VTGIKMIGPWQTRWHHIKKIHPVVSWKKRERQIETEENYSDFLELLYQKKKSVNKTKSNTKTAFYLKSETNKAQENT
jgi:hypothetical protein